MGNEEIRNQYDAYTRIEGFGEKYGAQFGPASRARNKFTLMTAVVAKMVANGVTKLTGSSGFHGGTGMKRKRESRPTKVKILIVDRCATGDE